jgi:hypothetical protein
MLIEVFSLLEARDVALARKTSIRSGGAARSSSHLAAHAGMAQRPSTNTVAMSWG